MQLLFIVCSTLLIVWFVLWNYCIHCCFVKSWKPEEKWGEDVLYFVPRVPEDEAVQVKYGRNHFWLQSLKPPLGPKCHKNRKSSYHNVSKVTHGDKTWTSLTLTFGWDTVVLIWQTHCAGEVEAGLIQRKKQVKYRKCEKWGMLMSDVSPWICLEM